MSAILGELDELMTVPDARPELSKALHNRQVNTNGNNKLKLTLNR